MFALYRFLQDSQNSAVALVNMCDVEGVKSRSHGITSALIREQSQCMGIPIIQQGVGEKGYEYHFKKVIANLVETQGVTAGVFGDIYLQQHRDWIERVCSEVGVTPIFPLWGMETHQLLHDFIEADFKTVTVSIRSDLLADSWLGRTIDKAFLVEISQLDGVDPCAENGEYHSFVYNGPLFKSEVKYSLGDIYSEGNHNFIQVISQ